MLTEAAMNPKKVPSPPPPPPRPPPAAANPQKATPRGL